MTHSIRDAIREIREMADAATEGPWEPFKWKDGSQDNSPLINVAAPAIESAIITNIPVEDAVFVASARTDIPRLCSLVELLVGALEKIHDKVESDSTVGIISEKALESAAKIVADNVADKCDYCGEKLPCLNRCYYDMDPSR